MQRLKAITITGAVLLVAFSGCAAPGGEVTPSSGRPPFQTMPAMNPSGSPATPSAEKLKAITADLAGRGITSEFSVVKSVAITWSDGSLGCPVAGKVYTQALVSGMQVVVNTAGKSYDYRFGAGDSPTLCASGK
jgi:hypothetical protein